MFDELINQGILFYVIAGICGIGTLSGLLVSFLYGRLVRDSKNMVTPKTKLMKQIKSKFEDSYKLNEIVNNVPVFVEKWMQRYKVLGVSMHGLRKIGIFAIGIGTLLSAGGLYLARDNGYSMQMQINYLMAGIASILLLIAIQGIADCTYKQKVILVNIRDYLENSLINRIGHETRDVIRIRERQSVGERVALDNRQAAGNSQVIESQQTRESKQTKVSRQSPDNRQTRENRQPVENQISPSYQAATDQYTETVHQSVKENQSTLDYQPVTDYKEVTDQAVTEYQAAAVHNSAHERRSNTQQTGKRDRQARSSRNGNKLSEMELKENIERMKQSMNQIAASTPEQRQTNKEILKGMDPKRQEEVIREILKEFLS